MPEIISRKKARERGLKRYFTGKPCCHGHVAERKLGGECFACADAYAAKNFERIRERNKKSSLARYHANPVKYRALSRDWARKMALSDPKKVARKERYKIRNSLINEAKSNGHLTYIGGACKRGHGGERYVSNNWCVGCRIESENQKKIIKLVECVICQQTFHPERNNRSKTCSPECRKGRLNAHALRHFRENRERHKQSSRKVYINGPSNPNGEKQWLSKAKAQLRSVKRVLRNRSQGASRSSPAAT